MLSGLPSAQEILLIVVEVGRHESRIVFSRRSLEGAKIGAVGLPALIEGHMTEAGSIPLCNIEEISEKSDVDLASFAGSVLFEVCPEYDMRHIFQRRNRPLHVVRRQQVDLNGKDAGQVLHGPSG